MSESNMESQLGPENEVEAFLDMHPDAWDQRADRGIALYKELKAAQDNQNAERVKNSLKNLITTMEQSGSGPAEEKRQLAEKIRTAINE